MLIGGLCRALRARASSEHLTRMEQHMTRQRSRNFGPALLAMAALGLAALCHRRSRHPTARDADAATRRALTAPAGQGELWACKFSVDPVTGCVNGDVTSGRITASLVSGDGTLNTAVSGGNNTLIGYNTPAPTPQCVKIWSWRHQRDSRRDRRSRSRARGFCSTGSSSAPRAPQFDDVYFTLDPCSQPGGRRSVHGERAGRQQRGLRDLVQERHG